MHHARRCVPAGAEFDAISAGQFGDAIVACFKLQQPFAHHLFGDVGVEAKVSDGKFAGMIVHFGRKIVRRRCCASATTATARNAAVAARAATVPIVPIAATVRIAAIGPTAPVVRVTTRKREPSDADRPPPPVFPSPQVVPIHRPERAEDRLKDTRVLSRYISERGKIVPSRITAVSAGKQRELAKAIKRARFLGLLPYVIR